MRAILTTIETTDAHSSLARLDERAALYEWRSAPADGLRLLFARGETGSVTRIRVERPWPRPAVLVSSPERRFEILHRLTPRLHRMEHETLRPGTTLRAEPRALPDLIL